MPVAVEVEGADKLRVVARALKDLGDKELRREFYAGMNRAVKPLTASVKQRLPERLPARYAALLRADLRVTTRRRTGGRNPAVFLLGKAKNRDIRSLNRGRLRHPLYGDREHWYDQPVQKGWWDQVLEDGAPMVRKEMVRVLDEVADQIVQKIKAG
jgi:hypothetical protein